MEDIQEWLAHRAQEDRHLYEQYGKPLEVAHKGEYVAIGPAGQTILGGSVGKVLKKAIEAFGSGNFGLFRVGHRALGRWITLSA